MNAPWDAVLELCRKICRLIVCLQRLVELVVGGDDEGPDPDDQVGGHQVRHQEVGQPLAVEDVQPGVDQNCGSLK